VLPAQIRGHVDNPYIGIVFFLILPIVFFSGLALIPIGVYLGRRQIQKGLTDPSAFDCKAALERLAWFFGATTLANLLIGTQVTYRAVEHMETPQFCGGTCHTMHPEFAAYQNSTHSRVECVECHVAPGAGGWIGSLQYNYHQPLAKVEVNLGHNLTGIAGWNYYQYGEQSFVGPTDPRYFHANNETFSLRWAF
jgi:hypothetical protein